MILGATGLKGYKMDNTQDNIYFSVTSGRVLSKQTIHDEHTKKIPYKRLLYLTENIDLDFLETDYDMMIITDVGNLSAKELSIFTDWLIARFHHLRNRAIERNLMSIMKEQKIYNEDTHD